MRAKVGYKCQVGYLCGVEIITGLLLGLAAAAGATFFPGLQNMAGVSVSLRAGRRAGYVFAAGMSVVLTLQAALAVQFAGYFSRHPSILTFMQDWAALVFFVLAAIFFFKGYRARVAHVEPADRPYHGNPFTRGALLAGMNFLVIPYFFALGGYLLSARLLDEGATARLAFVLGAGAGAMIIFGAYARSANWIDRKAHFLTRNLNFFLGGLLVAVAVVTFVRFHL